MNLSTESFGDVGKVLDRRRTEEKRFSRDVGKGLWELHVVKFVKIPRDNEEKVSK